MRHLMLPFVALGVLAVTVSGCGGDDDSAGSTTTERAAEVDTTTSTTTTSSTSTGRDSATGTVSPECEDLRAAFTSVDAQEMMSAFSDGSNPGPQFQAFAEAMALAEENAPEEIAADLAAMADSYAALADAADEIDWQAIQAGDPTASAAARDLMEGFSSEELADAGERVSTWLNDNCIPS